MFQNRTDAGEQLAKALKQYANQSAVTVVALPRGGVVVGRVVADALQAPLDIVVPRKIGHPMNPEYAIGAVAETGETVWNETEHADLSPEYEKKVLHDEQAEAQRRRGVYRAGLPQRNFKNKTIILVDDGLATGLTMRAAIKTVKAERAKKIVVAIPVASAEAADLIAAEVDDMVVLSIPAFFGAVGQFYQEFAQVEDGEVMKLMQPA